VGSGGRGMGQEAEVTMSSIGARRSLVVGLGAGGGRGPGGRVVGPGEEDGAWRGGWGHKEQESGVSKSGGGISPCTR
jgi:hypothetical protein